jgi:hypothetical protein
MLNLHACNVQAAANLPAQQAPAVTAAAIVQHGGEGRMWIRLRNPRPTKKLAYCADSGSQLLDLSLTNDGNTAAVLSVEGQVTVFDLVHGHQVTSLCDDTRRVTSVALVGARQVVTGAESGSITFWSLPTALAAKRGPSLALHNHPDNPFEASTAALHRGGTEEAQVHRSQVHRMAVSPNGHWLLTAGEDSTVKVVSVAQKAQRFSLVSCLVAPGSFPCLGPLPLPQRPIACARVLTWLHPSRWGTEEACWM